MHFIFSEVLESLSKIFIQTQFGFQAFFSHIDFERLHAGIDT